MPLRLQLPEQLGVPHCWEAAAEHAGTDTDPELADAVAYFRRMLRDTWAGWQRRFHLARSFHSSIQTGPREWVRLYRLAHELEGTPNLELLVQSLGGGTWRDHIAAEQALEFCGRFHGAGHRIELLRPTHHVTPDTRVWFRDRPVTVEFKALHDPEERAPWTAFETALTPGLMQRGLCGPDRVEFCARFDPPALVNVAAVIDGLAGVVAARDTSWRDLPEGTGRARFVADPEDTPGWSIPVMQQEDLVRVISNLHSKWIRQLRAVEGPTLLVVLTESMFFVPPEQIPAEVQRVTSTLRATLSRRRMLGAVLLHEEPFVPPFSPVLQVDHDWRFAMGGTEGRGRSALLVQNPAARAPLTSTELETLVGSAMGW